MLEKMNKGTQGLPCLHHSVILVDKFKFCDRIDWYCVLDDKNGEALFFDTGHPALTGTQLLREALNIRGISWNATSVFLTHFHVDHSGNLTYCLNNGARRVLFVQPVPYEANSASNFLSWTRSSSVMKNDEQTVAHRFSLSKLLSILICLMERTISLALIRKNAIHSVREKLLLSADMPLK